MSINKTSSSSFTSGVVIGDNTSNDSPVTLTPVNGVGVDAVLELRSTSGAFLPPRMTTAQINAISVQTDGMVAYNTDLNSLVVRRSGLWEITPNFNIVTKTLNQAQIHALNVAIPFVAGIANMLLVPLKVSAVYKYVAPVFTVNGGTSAINITYDNGNNSTATAIDPAIVTSAFSGVTDSLGYTAAAPVNITAEIGSGLNILSDGGGFLAGNAASTLTLTMYYAVLSVS